MHLTPFPGDCIVLIKGRGKLAIVAWPEVHDKWRGKRTNMQAVVIVGGSPQEKEKGKLKKLTNFTVNHL